MATIIGTPWEDVPLFGTDDGDWIEGRDGDDQLFGWGGNDVLLGGDGFDYILAGDGNDFVDGGADLDYILLDAGSDVGFGGFGDDFIFGGEGSDTLEGGLGDDYMDGGSGSDWVSYYEAVGPVRVDLTIQGVVQNTGDGFDTLVNVENLEGSFFPDVLIGNQIANWFFGYGGDDKILGFDGNDVIDGGDGLDTIAGGVGADRIIGGGGNDDFVYTSAAESSSTSFDTIVDGVWNNGDVFDIPLAVTSFVTLAGGKLDAARSTPTSARRRSWSLDARRCSRPAPARSPASTSSSSMLTGSQVTRRDRISSS